MTDTSAPGNPTPPQDPNGDKAPAPVMRVLGQYVKDLSFENPGHAPVQAQPNIDLGIDVGAKPHADGNGLFEVSLKLSAKAMSDGQVMFISELDYAGLFQLQNVAQDQLEPMLLIECPRLLCRAVPGPGAPRCRWSRSDPAIGLRPVSRDNRGQASR